MSLNCDDDISFCSRKLPPASYSLGKADVTPGHEPELARDGDPAQIVADSAQIRKALQWQPRFDDLSIIVAHALTWEQALSKRGAGAPQSADRRATASSGGGA